jgi:hypothetical protein
MEPTSGQAPASPGAQRTTAGDADEAKRQPAAAGSSKQRLPEVAVLAEELYSEDSALVGLRVKVRLCCLNAVVWFLSFILFVNLTLASDTGSHDQVVAAGKAAEAAAACTPSSACKRQDNTTAAQWFVVVCCYLSMDPLCCCRRCSCNCASTRKHVE